MSGPLTPGPLHTYNPAAGSGGAAQVTFTGVVAAANALLIGTPVVFDDVGGAGQLFQARSQTGRRCVGFSTAAFAAAAVATIAVVGLQAVEDAVWDVVAPATIPLVTDVGKPVYLGSVSGELTIARPTNIGEPIIVGTVRTGGAGAVVVAVEILHTTIRTLARFTANDATLPATAPATAIVVNEHAVIAFDDTVNERCEFSSYYPDWTNGEAGIEVELLWAAQTAVAGDVNWNVQFENLAISRSITVDHFDAVQAASNTTDGTLGDLSKATVSFTKGQADGPQQLRGFRIRVIRDAVDVLDTMLGDAQLLFVHVRQLTPP